MRCSTCISVAGNVDCFVCGLTFELSGRQRCDDWPARSMITSTASRARRRAVGSPLERVVRPQLSHGWRIP